jgi:hypothetical protein
VQFLQNRDYYSSCLTHADVVDALAAKREADDPSLGLVFTLDEE